MPGPTEGPILGPAREALGRERLERFIQGHAGLQAMAMFLVMSVHTAPRAGYSDDALDALKQDADDVRQAAERWASDCEELAGHWRAQRQEAEA